MHEAAQKPQMMPSSSPVDLLRREGKESEIRAANDTVDVEVKRPGQISRPRRLGRWRRLVAGVALALVVAFLVVAFIFPPFHVALVWSESYPLAAYLVIETRWPHLLPVRFSAFAPNGDEMLWGVTRSRSERIAILGETPGVYTVQATSGLRTTKGMQRLDDQ